MRSHPKYWATLMTKLGFRRNKRRSQSTAKWGRKLRFEHCEERRMLATFTVNDPGDFIDSDPNVTTLREAILQANQFPDLDTITFSTVPADNLDGATITLLLGELDITEAVTIDASMLTSGLTIDAQQNSRIFNIDDGDSNNNINVTITGLTFTGGSISTFAGGGAIYTNESLTINDSAFTNNTALGGNGGAISAIFATRVTINNSVFDDNSATTGGAIRTRGELSVFGSAFDRNHAAREGGALASRAGLLNVGGSVFTDNSADNRGGAIFMYGGGVHDSGIGNAPLARLHISDTDFLGNTSDGSGDAVFYKGFLQTGNGIVIESVLFDGKNKASYLGGGPNRTRFERLMFSQGNVAA